VKQQESQSKPQDKQEKKLEDQVQVNHEDCANMGKKKKENKKRRKKKASKEKSRCQASEKL
jgi:hypothetical protein